MTSPVVSVILPVYNGENYLRLAIESVFNQTLKELELIIIDDGSHDSTPEIARSFGDRLRYVRQANTGVAGAFNHGLKLAQGRFISWLSHDDLFLPEKLEKQVAALARLPTPAVCYTDVVLIDGNGAVTNEFRLPEYDRDHALRHVLTGGLISLVSYSIMYDRRCIEEVGHYSESWPYTQDAEMLVRLARRFPFIRVPEPLMQLREHENRGIHSPKWEREVVKFFSEQLSSIPLTELFPELGASPRRRDRSRAYEWLGDKLAVQADPISRVAVTQYGRALRAADPLNAFRLLRKIAYMLRTQRRAR